MKGRFFRVRNRAESLHFQVILLKGTNHISTSRRNETPRINNFLPQTAEAQVLKPTLSEVQAAARYTKQSHVDEPYFHLNNLRSDLSGSKRIEHSGHTRYSRISPMPFRSHRDHHRVVSISFLSSSLFQRSHQSVLHTEHRSIVKQTIKLLGGNIKVVSKFLIVSVSVNTSGVSFVNFPHERTMCTSFVFVLFEPKT